MHRTGIEPATTVPKTVALPLGERCIGRRCAVLVAPLPFEEQNTTHLLRPRTSSPVIWFFKNLCTASKAEAPEAGKVPSFYQTTIQHLGATLHTR